MNSRRIVLFDIDGTLMRGAGSHHKDALLEAARAVMGVGCSFDGVETAGCLDPDLLVLLLTKAGVAERRVLAKMARLLEAAQHHYTVNCKADFTAHVCPGVRSTLQLLAKEGIPAGIVTGNLSAIAWRKLENAGIDQHFQFGAFAEEAKTRTRLAQIALGKAKRKNLAAGNCSVTLVGDHANDIEAARANGFRCVAVATGMMKRDELSRFKPDLVLDSLEGASIESICGTSK